MKALLLALSTTLLIAATPYDANSHRIDNKPAAQAAAELVRAYNYRCDSISGFNKMIFSNGFTIHCNNFRYSYEIEDVGGKWRVTVK